MIWKCLYLLLAISLLFIADNISSAQEISVVINVVWRQDSDDILEHIPYLSIRYINDSATDYYFPALLFHGEKYPSFPDALRHHKDICSLEQSVEMLKNLKELHNGKHLQLKIGYLRHNSPDLWFLYEPSEDDIIEDTFYETPLAWYYEAKGHKEPIGCYFTKAELEDESFIAQSRAFVFLEAGASVEERIDISGLEIAGFITDVCIEPCCPPDRMAVAYGEYCKLPDKVGKFVLYRDEVASQGITIDFQKSALAD